jgi:hypothetical protein
VIVGRLNMNLAHNGGKHRAGEIVQLHLFTLLMYVTSRGGEEVERAPMVVIHTFSKIEYKLLPQNIGNPMTCAKMLEMEKDNELTVNRGGGGSVVRCLTMYHTKVLMYCTMVLMARPTKVRC